MIICAALKIRNDNAYCGYTVVPCWRHVEGYAIIQNLCPGIDESVFNSAEEGFIDNNNNFLTREEAYAHALNCGQLSYEVRRLKTESNEEMLFSEDLY